MLKTVSTFQRLQKTQEDENKIKGCDGIQLNIIHPNVRGPLPSVAYK